MITPIFDKLKLKGVGIDFVKLQDSSKFFLCEHNAHVLFMVETYDTSTCPVRIYS